MTSSNVYSRSSGFKPLPAALSTATARYIRRLPITMAEWRIFVPYVTATYPGGSKSTFGYDYRGRRTTVIENT
jgi:hypothetical protein